MGQLIFTVVKETSIKKICTTTPFTYEAYTSGLNNFNMMSQVIIRVSSYSNMFFPTTPQLHSVEKPQHVYPALLHVVDLMIYLEVAGPQYPAGLPGVMRPH